MKDRYDFLREKTERIFQEGKRLVASGEFSGYCRPDCASCLSADARGNVDEKDHEGGFDSSEDVSMLDARDRLAEELNMNVY